MDSMDVAYALGECMCASVCVCIECIAFQVNGRELNKQKNKLKKFQRNYNTLAARERLQSHVHKKFRRSRSRSSLKGVYKYKQCLLNTMPKVKAKLLYYNIINMHTF